MKQYLIVNREWKVLYGDYELTLLNWESGKILEIYGAKFKLFKMWHQGQPIMVESTNNKVKELIELIKINNIGKFENKYYVNEEYHIGKMRDLYSEKRAKLTRVFLELPGKCSYNCNYCLKKKTSPCWVCGKSENGMKVNLNVYYQIIDMLSKQGCEQIVFHGGNVFEYSDFLPLLKKVEECHIHPCILMDEKLIEKIEIDKIIDFNPVLVISVDCTEEINIEQFQYIKKSMCENDIDIKFSVILSQKTVEFYSKLEKEINAYDNDIINISLVTKEKITQEELNTTCFIENIQIKELRVLSQMNMCMAGMIAINSQLEVKPCPHMKQFVLGRMQVIGDKLSYIKEKNNITLSDFWLTSKSYIDQCSKCSKKYICMDCRALELVYGVESQGQYRKRECSYHKKSQQCIRNDL